MKPKPAFNLRGVWLLLDTMLPAPDDGVDRNRSYLSIASFIFVILLLVVNLFSFLFAEAEIGVVYGTGVLLIITLSCLWALKRGCKLERVTGLFLFFLTTIITLMITFNGRSTFAPGLFFFLLIIMYVSFFASNRWATLQAVYIVLATIFFFVNTTQFGIRVPFHWVFIEFVHRLQFVVALLCFTSFVCMVLHDYFKRKAASVLSQEKAWLVRSSRLHEISTLADSLSFQISGPLKEFGKDLRDLRDAAPAEDFTDQEVKLVGTMFRSVEELIQISRSFDWIYRSQKQDNLAGATLGVLLSHLRVLLEGKALENGWGLNIHTDHANEEMHGRIPSLVLLIVTLAHRNFDRYTANSEMALRVEAHASPETPETLQWRLSWPKTSDKAFRFREDSAKRDLSVMVDEIREALIDELRKDCLGHIEWTASDTRYEVNLIVPKKPHN